jgi:hypothetical protein
MGYRVNLAAADSFARPASSETTASLSSTASSPAVVAALPEHAAWEAALVQVIDEPVTLSRRNHLAVSPA